jgi:hypothetical protein
MHARGAAREVASVRRVQDIVSIVAPAVPRSLRRSSTREISRLMQLKHVAVAAAVITSAATVPTMSTLAAPAAAAANCTCLPSAADADLITALGWVCGPGGKIDCSPINTGGSHFFPNDAVDHANYAFTEFYHAHAADGYDTCFCEYFSLRPTDSCQLAVHVPSRVIQFGVCWRGPVCAVGGNAAVNPPPVGHWLFVQGGALDYPYPQAKAGIGLWDTIPSGKSATYATGPFNGKFQALPGGFSSTVFSLWLAATTAPTDVHVEITYNLPCGSATLPRYRREWYNKMTLAAAPKYEAYTNALGFAEPPVGTFCPGVQNTGAQMNVTVTALAGGENHIAYLRDTRTVSAPLAYEPGYLTHVRTYPYFA